MTTNEIISMIVITIVVLMVLWDMNQDKEDEPRE
jgi:hypothetical protein